MVSSSGPSGHNVEYVLRLAEWMHAALPEVWDDHLFSIERAVRRKVVEQGLCLSSIMKVEKETGQEAEQEVQGASQGAGARPGGYQGTCHKTCLKCVKL